ncbi:hypothetical protein DEU47_1116 [Bacillus sp. AG236]|uniref:hypothetical protein n=1 Tax=Priestia megaterium TaxID=1404 RepID=UPI000DFE247C|nr:hypothetical protein [Priestia megaterium]RCX19519.1 hypothetical protein DEU47_1116 [Bacillus sp. AG236]
MTNYGYYTGSLFLRELERLKEEYIQLDLDDMKVMMKEDILLLEKAMNMLCRNKVC